MTKARSAATFRYRPGLDGVRALAVAAVILYHAQVSWMKGGFLGVDVFFVLSGYLITSLLLSERERTGKIDLLAFWSRRARRLLPALFLVIAGVAVYAVVWAAPTELGRIRNDGLASLLYVANWKFIVDGSTYFQQLQAPSPLAHMWSLAVEEQWYVLWPMLLLVLMRVVRANNRVFAAAVAALALCSAALMALLFHPGTDPSRVYYGTDTRAQELLIGAVLAALTGGPRPAIPLDRLRRPWLLQGAGMIGAAVVAVLTVRADAQGAFLYRGGFLLTAVAVAAFVAAATVEGPLASVLSVRPLVAVGVISYGLYLWHWPVDVLLDSTRTGLSGIELFTVRIAATGAIATASYFVVERPIRRNGLAFLGSRAWSGLRPAVVAFAAATTAAVLVVATVGAVGEPSLAALLKAHPAPKPDLDPKKPRMLLLGDSQMFTLLFYGSGTLATPGVRYSYAPVVGCGVFDSVEHVGEHCADRLPTWEKQIHDFNPDLSVLLIGGFEALDFSVDGHVYKHGTPEHEQELVRIITSALRTLTARGGRVALLEVPCFGDSHGPDQQSIHDRNLPSSIANVNGALETVANNDPEHVTFVQWSDAICPGGHFVAKIDGIVVRPDGVHFSPAGAVLVAKRLAPVLNPLAVADAAARPNRS